MLKQKPESWRELRRNWTLGRVLVAACNRAYGSPSEISCLKAEISLSVPLFFSVTSRPGGPETWRGFGGGADKFRNWYYQVLVFY